MQRKGIVYIPKGDYFISKPIIIPQGITLKGDSGHLYDHSSTTIYPLGTVDKKRPVLTGKNAFIKDFPHEYMFYVNCDTSKTPSLNHANFWFAIKNITLINYPDVNKNSRCIYACYGAGFDTVHWYDFLQAIAYSDDYADGKCIINCSAGADSLFDIDDYAAFQEPDLHMFNIGGLGDAVIFTHNSLQSPLNRILYVKLCGGGPFQSNNINGDITFHGCKGISYTDNHMEYGAQIKIENSIVNISTNYIEKGDRPSIIISSVEKSRSVVSLSQTQFAFVDKDRNEYETNDKNIKADRIEHICEYDVEIDSRSLLYINNTYRYQLVVGFDPSVPYGIKIKTPDSDFSGFNELSYFQSRHSQIIPGYAIQSQTEIKSPDTPVLNHIQKVEWVNWFRPPGSYRYYYQIIWNQQRNIKKSVNRNSLFLIAASESEITFPDQSKGTLLQVDGFNDGNCMTIRLYREHIADLDGNNIGLVESVDIPLCGANMIYDNGISICGFKWKQSSLPEKLDQTAHQFDYLEITSNRVNAWTPKKPTCLSGWLPGDIIYNSGDDESWSELLIRRKHTI